MGKKGKCKRTIARNSELRDDLSGGKIKPLSEKEQKELDKEKK